jgi:glycosyltransferase involved in cell wall biosynthesis
MSDYLTNNYEFYFIIPDLEKGGGERVTCEIIKILAKKNCEITVYTESIAPLGDSGTQVNFIGMKWSNRIETLHTLIMMFYFSSKKSVIIPVLTGPILMIGIINIFFRRRVIAYEHSDLEALYLNTSYFKKIIRKSSIRVALFGTSKYIVVSNYIKRRMNSIFKYDENRMVVAQNPFTGFLKKISQDQYATKPNNPSAKFTAYIIGRFSQEKRIVEAVEYAAKSSGIDRIVVVTDDNLWPSKFLSAHAISKVSLINSYDEINSFTPINSLLINFSTVESYSLVIAEWLASGLPVFTVSTTNLHELWSNYSGCFFIDEGVPLTLKIIQTALCEKKFLGRRNLTEVPIEITVSQLILALN